MKGSLKRFRWFKCKKRGNSFWHKRQYRKYEAVDLNIQNEGHPGCFTVIANFDNATRLVLSSSVVETVQDSNKLLIFGYLDNEHGQILTGVKECWAYTPESD